MFIGNFNGFNTYDIETPKKPRLLASVVCPGGQGDVSVHGNLLFMSVEQTRGRIDCGTQGVNDPVSAERFRGIRIFDITDISKPKQVAAVQTCRGSHTHTLVTDPKDKANIYIYGSGTSGFGRERSSPAVHGASRTNPNTALFSIDVIQVPLAAPQNAKIVNRRASFADIADRRHCGPWQGRRPRARHAKDERDQPVPRHHGLSPRSAWPRAPARATASCSTFAIRRTRCASTR